MSSTDISSPSPTRPQRVQVARWMRSSLDEGFLREAALVTGAIFAYFTIRNVTAGAPAEAFANGDRIVDFERWLGIDWEDGVQGAIAGRDGLFTFSHSTYHWGARPVILSTAVALHVWRRDSYYLLR